MADSNKPSFMHSINSGIRGFIKGMLAGGFVGMVNGAIIGGVVAAFTMNPLAIVAGAIIGGGTFAAIGSIAAATTEVIKSREPQLAGVGDSKALNMAYAQGVAAGREMEMSQASSRHFQDMLEQRRAETERVNTR